MKQRPLQRRRGMALLIALALTLVLTSAAVSLSAATAHARAAQRTAAMTSIACEQLDAADEVISHWLSKKASTVVLAPDNATSEVPVIHDAWQVEDIEFELRITAWDQCGMVPVRYLRPGSPLRSTIPEPVLRVVDARAGVISGLDQLTDPFDSAFESPFPLALPAEPITFGSFNAQSRLPHRINDQTEQASIGASVSTHGNSLNIHTAPIELLEQVMRLNGRGGIEQIIAARHVGTRAIMGDLPRLNSSSPSAQSLTLSGSSNAWAFRIDARVDRVRLSWWTVYVAPNPGDISWRCAQRLVIRD